MEHFDSSDAFRYIWTNWRILGLNPFPKYRSLYLIYAVFITITVAVIPPIQQLVQAFFVDTAAELMSNLSISLEWACGCFKHYVIIVWHKSLRDSHQYLKRLDDRAQRHNEEFEVLKRTVKNCHWVYIIYNVSFWITLSFFGINGYLNKRMMFESYIPWDWKASTRTYLLSFFYQWIISGLQLILNLACDIYSICYVYMMLGHMRTLIMRISRIGYDTSVSLEDNYEELISCVHDHRNILLFFDHIRPAISRTILIQFTVTAFALCLATFYYVVFNSSLTMLITTLTYFSVLFAQVMPCCYLVNDLMIVSDYLTTALYSCNWMDQSPKFRKTLIIFMQRTQKTNTIVAGNLAPVTVQSCLKIIRFSFSMFTILTQM